MKDNELDCIGTTIALLTRHDYWKDQLWKTRPATKEKYKDYDPADIHNALLAKRLLSIGVYTIPCGMCWCHKVDDKQKVIDYYSEYDELFEDYWQWQLEYR